LLFVEWTDSREFFFVKLEIVGVLDIFTCNCFVGFLEEIVI